MCYHYILVSHVWLACKLTINPWKGEIEMKAENKYAAVTMTWIIVVCILSGLAMHVVHKAMQKKPIGVITSCEPIQKGLYTCGVFFQANNPSEKEKGKPFVFANQEIAIGTRVELIKSPGIWIASPICNETERIIDNSHPEIQFGEIYIGNMEEKFVSYSDWTTSMRLGVVAYDNYGKRIPGFRPLFVKQK